MKALIQPSLFLLCLLLAFQSFASHKAHQDYYIKHEKGWHWYKDKALPKKARKQSGSHDHSAPALEYPATQAMLKHRAKITEALNQAVLNPTTHNVRHYIKLQQQDSQRAGEFADSWQRVLWKHPELDYTLKHPINHIAAEVDTDLRRSRDNQIIKTFFKDKGLFFFYKSTCPYCRRFAPILKAFARQHHIAVVPITLDRISIPEFPHSKIDMGQARAFGVKAEPALFLVNPYTHKATLISYGLVSGSEITARVVQIARHFKGDY